MYFMACVAFVALLTYGESIPYTAVDRAVHPFADWFLIHVGEMLPLAYFACVVYVACVYSVTVHKGYDLKGVLACWSFSLAAFSAYGSVRSVHFLASNMWENGFHYSVCSNEFYTHDNIKRWSALFAFSKLPELIDTVFIVLRKKPLIFLHWYHHVTVLLYTWHCIAERSSSALWFGVMNYTVHAFMYLFYGFVALGVRPSWFARYITIIQIAQMVFGMAISLYTLANIPECKTSWENGVSSSAMYTSYMFLFVRFYHETYCGERRQKTD
jgi:elongation of very long chain fatty acids protein 6